MTTNYNFIETFNTKLSDPDLFDAGGAVSGGVDQFFAELGKIAKAAHEGNLTAADAQSAKIALQKFSDGINRLNARIAQTGVAAGNAQDAKFSQVFRSLVNTVNVTMQQFSYAADEVIAGNASSLIKLSSAASSVCKNVGGLLGLAQIGKEFYDKGLTANGVDGAGEKALGVITGMAGAEIAAVAVGGLAVFFGAPVIVAAGAAIVGAVLAGYVAGKAGESLWEPSRWWFENEFLPSVFDTGTQAANTISTGLADIAVSMGRFDGTWLEGFDASDEDKASFTTLLAGASQLPASTAMNADLQRLLEAPFDGSTLISRDVLIRSVLLIAQEQGAYVSERVAVSAGIVALDFPPGAPMALDTMRELLRGTLSSSVASAATTPSTGSQETTGSKAARATTSSAGPPAATPSTAAKATTTSSAPPAWTWPSVPARTISGARQPARRRSRAAATGASTGMPMEPTRLLAEVRCPWTAPTTSSTPKLGMIMSLEGSATTTSTAAMAPMRSRAMGATTPSSAAQASTRSEPATAMC